MRDDRRRMVMLETRARSSLFWSMISEQEGRLATCFRRAGVDPNQAKRLIIHKSPYYCQGRQKGPHQRMRCLRGIGPLVSCSIDSIDSLMVLRIVQYHLVGSGNKQRPSNASASSSPPGILHESAGRSRSPPLAVIAYTRPSLIHL